MDTNQEQKKSFQELSAIFNLSFEQCYNAVPHDAQIWITQFKSLPKEKRPHFSCVHSSMCIHMDSGFPEPKDCTLLDVWLKKRYWGHSKDEIGTAEELTHRFSEQLKSNKSLLFLLGAVINDSLKEMEEVDRYRLAQMILLVKNTK